jgi:hypothetical protein
MRERAASETIVVPNVDAALDLLFARALQIADRVELGLLPFIDGVDLAYSAAQWSGLVDIAGDDLVQHVLASAFMYTPRGSAS